MVPAGQDTDAGPATRSGGLDEGGFILVALLVGIAVTAVWMTALLPSWRQQAMREREAELVFRGEQYARAIALYRRKNGTLPLNIDLLVSQHYLRKKYLDPITGKDFLPVAGVQNGVPSTPGSQPPIAQPGARGAAPPSPSFNPGIGQLAQGGIVGVRSTSHDTSIRVYYGQTTYSQWPFDWTSRALFSGDPSLLNQNGNQNRGVAPGMGGELPPLTPGGAFPGGRGGRGPGAPGAGGTAPGRGAPFPQPLAPGGPPSGGARGR